MVPCLACNNICVQRVRLEQSTQALQAVGAALGVAVIAERSARTVAARALPGLTMACDCGHKS